MFALAILCGTAVVPWDTTLPFASGGVAGLMLGTWSAHRLSPVCKTF